MTCDVCGAEVTAMWRVVKRGVAYGWHYEVWRLYCQNCGWEQASKKVWLRAA